MTETHTGAWETRIYILIPAYKACDTLSRFLPLLLEKIPAPQILVGDDGSNDGTAHLCASLGIDCLSHPINRGKGAILRSGFERLLEKKARWIITMDADGQHSVSDLPHFIEALNRWPDAGLIIGCRQQTISRMPLARILSNRLTSLVTSLFAGVPIRDSQCGYRFYSSELLRAITIRFPRFEMETEVILKAAAAGFPIHFVEIQTLYCSPRSHIAHLRDTLRWVRAVLSVQREVSGRKDRNR